jgi:hypothetical protein
MFKADGSQLKVLPFAAALLALDWCKRLELLMTHEIQPRIT